MDAARRFWAPSSRPTPGHPTPASATHLHHGGVYAVPQPQRGLVSTVPPIPDQDAQARLASTLRLPFGSITTVRRNFSNPLEELSVSRDLGAELLGKSSYQQRETVRSLCGVG